MVSLHIKQLIYQPGQKGYEYMGKCIWKDKDGHNGGFWKVFESEGGRLKRIGTVDEHLTIYKNNNMEMKLISSNNFDQNFQNLYKHSA